jgi:uncharacterized protein (DUF58 family)
MAQSKLNPTLPANEARPSLRERIADWIFRARSPEQPPVVLVQRRIFIIPSRNGFYFAFVLLLLLIASINYALSLGYFLTFLLAGLGSVAMLHTFRNLAQLAISYGKCDPVFAGEVAHFPIILHNDSLPRYAVAVKRKADKIRVDRISQGAIKETKAEKKIRLLREAEIANYADIATHNSATIVLPAPTQFRGRLKLSRIEVFTEYPVGLFHAWSYVNFDISCLVYPKPDSRAGALPSQASANGSGNIPIKGDEEFQSLRAYKPGDTPRQIAWKALAREQGLLTKEFGSTGSADLWLNYDDLPHDGMEDRLAKLTYWVLEADRQERHYGLALPTLKIAPSYGATHRLACLEALALYRIDDNV